MIEIAPISVPLHFKDSSDQKNTMKSCGIAQYVWVWFEEKIYKKKQKNM